MSAGVWKWGTKPIVVAGVLGAVLVCRGMMVLLMGKSWDMKVHGGVWCSFNEIHWVTRYGANHGFGDNFWDI